MSPDYFFSGIVKVTRISSRVLSEERRRRLRKGEGRREKVPTSHQICDCLAAQVKQSLDVHVVCSQNNLEKLERRRDR
jgi:hypothetical protein